MAATATEKRLLVQGWTGINHSYAMVNQYQLLELARLPALQLLQQEMPLYDSRWSREKNAAGFSAAEQQALAAIPAYAGEPVSAVYRIHTPNTLALTEAIAITFLVTELGLDAANFVAGADVQAYCAAGHLVVTPSQWSRDRLLDFGFAPASVWVIPHGVDSGKFYPFAAAEREAARSALGFGADDVVFLNVGAPIWNKGLDLVIEAFFKLRQTHKTARLLIKDQNALYGFSAVDMVRNLAASGTIEIDNASVESIKILPQTLSQEQLRSLYNVADFYLSPYRAEGFNLPVIEAMACGTPAIVTAGGSTDDFCSPQLSHKIPSTLHRNATVNNTLVGAYLQPDMEALVGTLRQLCVPGARATQTLAFGRANLVAQFSWQRAAQLIAALV
jgi:glycosyltransferase involved in cell wall biosynthesis